jgi:hypothetical protein
MINDSKYILFVDFYIFSLDISLSLYNIFVFFITYDKLIYVI